MTPSSLCCLLLQNSYSLQDFLLQCRWVLKNRKQLHVLHFEQHACNFPSKLRLKPGDLREEVLAENLLPLCRLHLLQRCSVELRGPACWLRHRWWQLCRSCCLRRLRVHGHCCWHWGSLHHRHGRHHARHHAGHPRYAWTSTRHHTHHWRGHSRRAHHWIHGWKWRPGWRTRHHARVHRVHAGVLLLHCVHSLGHLCHGWLREASLPLPLPLLLPSPLPFPLRSPGPSPFCARPT